MPSKTQPDVSDVLSMISEFCTELIASIYGTGRTPDTKAFIQKNREIYAEFKKKIRATVPDFKPFVNGCKYDSIEEHSDMADYRVRSLDLHGVRDVIKRYVLCTLSRLSALAKSYAGICQVHSLGATSQRPVRCQIEAYQGLC